MDMNIYYRTLVTCRKLQFPAGCNSQLTNPPNMFAAMPSYFAELLLRLVLVSVPTLVYW